MFKKLIFVSIFCGSTFINCFAQSPTEIASRFPNEEAIFLQYNQELKLSVKEGNVVAESNNLREIMILTDKNAAAYSRSKIYHSTYSELKSFNAYSKIPNGNDYKKINVGEQLTTSSNRTNVFYDDTKVTTFDFLGMVPNAIQYVQYKLFNKDAHLLSPFYVPSSISIASATFTVVVPNDITINYKVKNDVKGQFKFSLERKKKETVYSWSLQNYKGVEQYVDAPNESYYEPHVIVYVTGFTENNITTPYLNNVDELYKWNISFLKNLNTKPDIDLQKIVTGLVSDKKNDYEKAKAIYKWVQTNIKYIAFESGLEGFTPRQAADVCLKRYGDCKDMSSIITEMLKMASIKAYFTWIGTRDIAYQYSDVPLPIVDNHMITTAFINNEWIFLDGTNPHASFGVPPAFIQGKEALIALSDNDYKILTIPVAPYNQNGMVDTTLIAFTKEGIKGEQRVKYFGYLGEDYYNSLLYKNEVETKTFVKSRMGKASNKFILGKYTINEKDVDKNILGISAEFEIPGIGKKIGDEYYINLNLEKLFENQTIDIEKRKVPIEEKYKYTYDQFHILKIPEGYKVSYVPNDFVFDNELIALKINYQVKDGNITSHQQLQKKKMFIDPKEFIEWNKAANAVAPQYKEQVVLELEKK